MNQPLSPLPWVIENCSNNKYPEYFYIRCKEGISDTPYISRITPEDEYPLSDCLKDAEYIVESCNNYPKLIQLIKDILKNEDISINCANEIRSFLY